MPDYRRPRMESATVFFIVTLADRGSDVLVREAAALRAAVAATRAERPFGIVEWVVLPDHLHCVWRLPDGDADFATRWRLIKSRFSRAVPIGARRDSHVARGERGVWQRRFWERHVRGEAELAAYRRYCWFNPVKHGLVARPEDWALSSVHRAIRSRIYAGA